MTMIMITSTIMTAETIAGWDTAASVQAANRRQKILERLEHQILVRHARFSSAMDLQSDFAGPIDG